MSSYYKLFTSFLQESKVEKKEKSRRKNLKNKKERKKKRNCFIPKNFGLLQHENLFIECCSHFKVWSRNRDFPSQHPEKMRIEKPEPKPEIFLNFAYYSSFLNHFLNVFLMRECSRSEMQFRTKSLWTRRLYDMPCACFGKVKNFPLK